MKVNWNLIVMIILTAAVVYLIMAQRDSRLSNSILETLNEQNKKLIEDTTRLSEYVDMADEREYVDSVNTSELIHHYDSIVSRYEGAVLNLAEKKQKAADNQKVFTQKKITPTALDSFIISKLTK